MLATQGSDKSLFRNCSKRRKYFGREERETKRREKGEVISCFKKLRPKALFYLEDISTKDIKQIEAVNRGASP
jgi:hypothetical protein